MEQATKLMAEFDAKISCLVQDLVGAEVARVVKADPDHYVDSPDAKVRFAALAEIAANGVISETLAERCEAFAIQDSDAYVRGAAITCLCKYYRATNNRRIGQLFATIVHNEKERDDVRWVAYGGLGHLGDQLDWTHSPVVPGFSFPAHIDWNWVNKFLKGKEKGKGKAE